MISIEKMCKGLTEKIARELQLEINKKAVIQYGLFAIIQTVLSLLMIILFGMVFDVMLPALVLSLSSVILRKYSGGVHAKTPESCMVIGTIISVGGALILSYINWKVIDILLWGIGVFVVAFYLVYQLAPIDSLAKPIKNKQRKQLLKKKSMQLLSVYLLIVVILIALFFMKQDQSLLLTTGCIYLGVLWQIFTLTSKGHLVVEKLDDFLIHTMLRGGAYTNEKD